MAKTPTSSPYLDQKGLITLPGCGQVLVTVVGIEDQFIRIYYQEQLFNKDGMSVCSRSRYEWIKRETWDSRTN
jgi:hypothetical protein